MSLVVKVKLLVDVVKIQQQRAIKSDTISLDINEKTEKFGLLLY